MNKIRKIFHTVTLSLVTLLIPLISYAATTGGGDAVTVKNPLGTQNKNLFTLISAVLDFVVKIGAVIAVFMIIYSGFLFVTAQGDSGKISTAKSTFMWTVIGALVLLGAEVLAQIVCNTANGLGAGVSCRSII